MQRLYKLVILSCLLFLVGCCSNDRVLICNYRDTGIVYDFLVREVKGDIKYATTTFYVEQLNSDVSDSDISSYKEQLKSFAHLDLDSVYRYTDGVALSSFINLQDFDKNLDYSIWFEDFNSSTEISFKSLQEQAKNALDCKVSSIKTS